MDTSLQAASAESKAWVFRIVPVEGWNVVGGGEAECLRSASSPLALRRRSGSLPSVAPILRAGVESVAQGVGFVQVLVLSKEPRSLPSLSLGVGWLC